MDASSISQVSLSINTYVGALEVGILLSGLLFGVYAYQAWNYFQHCYRDQLWVKALVSLVTFFNIVHTALLGHAFWSYTVDTWGVPSAVDTLFWSLIVSLYFGGLLVLVTQTFLSFQIWKLTQKRAIPLLCVALVCSQYAVSVLLASLSFETGTFPAIATSFSEGIIRMLSLGVASSLIISLSLCLALYRELSHLRGRSVADKFVTCIISTGFLTTVPSLVALICYATMSNAVWMSALLIAVELFPNCLLSALNDATSLGPIPTRHESQHFGSTAKSSRTSGTRTIIPHISIGFGAPFTWTHFSPAKEIDHRTSMLRDEDSPDSCEGTLAEGSV